MNTREMFEKLQEGVIADSPVIVYDVKLSNKIAKLKRKTKKLRRELDYWKKQADIMHQGMLHIKMSDVTTDSVKMMADKYLDERRVNEYKFYYPEGYDNG